MPADSVRGGSCLQVSQEASRHKADLLQRKCESNEQRHEFSSSLVQQCVSIPCKAVCIFAPDAIDNLFFIFLSPLRMYQGDLEFLMRTRLHRRSSDLPFSRHF